jgi:hypothetical protein
MYQCEILKNNYNKEEVFRKLNFKVTKSNRVYSLMVKQ